MLPLQPPDRPSFPQNATPLVTHQFIDHLLTVLGTPKPERRAARPLASARWRTRSIFGLLDRWRLLIHAGDMSLIFVSDLIVLSKDLVPASNVMLRCRTPTSFRNKTTGSLCVISRRTDIYQSNRCGPRINHDDLVHFWRIDRS